MIKTKPVATIFYYLAATLFFTFLFFYLQNIKSVPKEIATFFGIASGCGWYEVIKSIIKFRRGSLK